MSANCPSIFPLISPNFTHNLCAWLFQTKIPLNLSTKLVIQFFHTSVISILPYNCSSQLSRQICPLNFQPNLANHFFHTVFKNIFHPLLSTDFPTQLIQPIFQYNYPQNFSTIIFHIILYQVFQQIYTLLSYTQFFHALCQSTFLTLLPYPLITL